MNNNEETPVKVILRLRPLMGKELTNVPLSCTEISGNLITVYPPGSNSLTFSLDSIRNSIATQDEIYNDGPKNIVESVMQGFNGTIFAYGGISSGKTFTMFGNINDDDKKGIVPRVVSTLFDCIDSAQETVEFLVKVSFYEIFVEKISDLLNPQGKSLKLKSNNRGVYIENIREVYTACDFDIQELIKVGLSNKNYKDLQHPERGSASHTIFSITVQQTDAENVIKTGKLCLVDLAGSEKLQESHSSQSKLEKIKSVNTSLSALGSVITSLSEKSSLLSPFRASKLTQLLQDSLGGNSKTVIIITCSPSPINYDETISSLRFATRIKAIKNFPIVNRERNINDLKKIFIAKEAELNKLDKKIALYESKARKTEKLSLRLSSEEESLKDSVDYSEVKQEIEEIRIRITEQENIKHNYLSNIISFNTQIKELQEKNSFSKEIITKLSKQSESLDTEVKEAENNLDSVLASVESLSLEYETVSSDIEKLENDTGKLIANIEHSNCQLKCLTDMRSSLSKMAVEEQLRKRIKEEKEKNKVIKEEMKKKQYEIDLLLFKKYKDYMEADILQTTGKNIFELELKIDKARMKYLQDEKNLTVLQKYAKNKRDGLSITADKVSKNFRTLTSKFSESQIEKMLIEKKFLRLQQKAAKLEDDIARIDKRLVKVENNQSPSYIGEITRRKTRPNNPGYSLVERRIQNSLIGSNFNK